MLYPKLIIRDRYEIEKPIAPGGMSEVWLAKDTILDRKVAIKTLNLKMIEASNDNLSILENEAKVGASLIGHPNVLTTLDYGSYKSGDYDYAFIVSEFIDGYDLEKFINKFKSILDPVTYYYLGLYIAWEILKALDYAHKNNIQHRDVKPLNIFISKFGTTKIGDFGLARFIDVATRSHTLNNFSSPPYCAPEQWKGEKTNLQTDIYQLACTIHHLLTGEHVFVVESKVALLNAHLYQEPKSLLEVNELVNEEISTAITNMLSKDRDDRDSIWVLNDAIAKELHTKFKLKISLDSKNEELIDLVCNITDFSREKFIEDGDASFTFPDFNEICAEGIQLLCNNVTSFKIIPLDVEEEDN